MAGTLPAGSLAEAHKKDYEKTTEDPHHLMTMHETTQSSEHGVVMKCRRVAFGAGKGCLREGTLFTDIEVMAVISHK